MAPVRSCHDETQGVSDGPVRRYRAAFMDAFEAIETVRQTVADHDWVRWCYVFGSVARGGSFRDVDVAVMPTTGATALSLGALVARLEQQVGCKVDLVDLTSTDLPFVGPMLRERIVVLDREPDARRDWEVDMTSRWIDFEPSYREYLDRRERAAQLRRERRA